MRALPTIGVVAALLGVIAAPASAATRYVPFQYPTIQSAVNSASNFDTILIYPGEYRENVVIPAGKSLTVTSLFPGQLCSDNTRVIVDGSPAGVPGDVFQVFSDRTTIQCLTIRHGVNGVFGPATNDLTVQNVRFLRNLSFGVFVIGDRARVLDSSFMSNVYAVYGVGNSGQVLNSTGSLSLAGGYFVVGDSWVLQGNTARNVEGSFAFFVAGTGNRLQSNTVDVSLGIGLYVVGDSNQVLSNKTFNTDFGVYTTGQGNVITGNQVDNCGTSGCFLIAGDFSQVRNNVAKGAGANFAYTVAGFQPIVEANSSWNSFGGFYVAGDYPIVRGNTATYSGDMGGFIVTCTNCNPGRLDGNVVSGTTNPAYGFEVLPGGPGFVVQSNRATNNNGYGLYLAMSNGTILLNTATNNGTYLESGILIGGDGNTVLSNTSSWNGDSGFFIAGTGNVLRSNTGSYNLDDGFANFGASTTLDRNTAQYNQGEGFENYDGGAVITTNTSRYNRKGTDCTADTAPAVNAGNICGDGSNFLVPHQIN